MIFTKKSWSRRNRLTISDLNRFEAGIFEALSEINTLKSQRMSLSGISTVPSSNFVQNKNYSNADKPFSDGYYTGVLHVNFETAFTETPSVVVSAITSDPLSISANPGGVSKTGFDIIVRRKSNGNTTTVHWIAAAAQN